MNKQTQLTIGFLIAIAGLIALAGPSLRSQMSGAERNRSRLPQAIDDDQLNNATRLAELGAAWCIEQKELTPERLASAISRLLGAPDMLAQAAAAAKRQGRPDAVVRLADLVEELIGSGQKSA